MCFGNQINLHCLEEPGDLVSSKGTGNHYLDLINLGKHKRALSIHWGAVSWGPNIFKV